MLLKTKLPFFSHFLFIISYNYISNAMQTYRDSKNHSQLTFFW